mmetsp:Transcript_6439/g.10078  ORF Transcript_6439/g.10078 Transcript_6439/m.10078 type:complete len:501 (+) Transcript_6439:218-1720(+)
MSQHNSIEEEVAEAQSMFPAVNVPTSTPSFLIAIYQRSPYTRIKMTMTFPDGYPTQHPLIVNIDQDAVVPPGLKKKLEKELNLVATEQPTQQVRAVWERLISFVDTNLFVPCWKDLRQSVEMVQKSDNNTITAAAATSKSTTGNNNKSKKQTNKQSTITLYESKGKIKLSLYNEAYYINVDITIDPAYPDFSAATGGKSCLLELKSTNFPKSITDMMMTQAQDIVRRMQEGLSAARATNLSNPVKVPKNFHLNIDEMKEKYKTRLLTKDTISNIKHDTEALKKVTDLRNKEASSVRAPGDNGYVDHKALAKERKDARRAIQKLTEEEKAADQQLEEKELAWKLEEQKRTAGYYDVYIPTGGTITPQPSLYVLVTFLIEKVKGLVVETCPCCKKRVLPICPDELKSIYNSSSSSSSNKTSAKNNKELKKMKPYRTYCGCWYHKSCLNTLLTEPPFGIECPNEQCGRRVFHPEWPGDVKQLEREWAAKQARLREIEDAMCFL